MPNKYSHALVLAHYENSGLLDIPQRRYVAPPSPVLRSRSPSPPPQQQQPAIIYHHHRPARNSYTAFDHRQHHASLAPQGHSQNTFDPSSAASLRSSTSSPIAPSVVTEIYAPEPPKSPPSPPHLIYHKDAKAANAPKPRKVLVLSPTTRRPTKASAATTAATSPRKNANGSVRSLSTVIPSIAVPQRTSSIYQDNRSAPNTEPQSPPKKSLEGSSSLSKDVRSIAPWPSEKVGERIRTRKPSLPRGDGEVKDAPVAKSETERAHSRSFSVPDNEVGKPKSETEKAHSKTASAPNNDGEKPKLEAEKAHNRILSVLDNEGRKPNFETEKAHNRTPSVPNTDAGKPATKILYITDPDVPNNDVGEPASQTLEKIMDRKRVRRSLVSNRDSTVTVVPIAKPEAEMAHDTSSGISNNGLGEAASRPPEKAANRIRTRRSGIMKRESKTLVVPPVNPAADNAHDQDPSIANDKMTNPIPWPPGDLVEGIPIRRPSVSKRDSAVTVVPIGESEAENAHNINASISNIDTRKPTPELPQRAHNRIRTQRSVISSKNSEAIPPVEKPYDTNPSISNNDMRNPTPWPRGQVVDKTVISKPDISKGNSEVIVVPIAIGAPEKAYNIYPGAPNGDMRNSTPWPPREAIDRSSTLTVVPIAALRLDKADEVNPHIPNNGLEKSAPVAESTVRRSLARERVRPKPSIPIEIAAAKAVESGIAQPSSAAPGTETKTRTSLDMERALIGLSRQTKPLPRSSRPESAQPNRPAAGTETKVKTSLDMERALIGLSRQTKPLSRSSRPESAQPNRPAAGTETKTRTSLDMERALIGLSRQTKPLPRSSRPESTQPTLPPLDFGPGPKTSLERERALLGLSRPSTPKSRGPESAQFNLPPLDFGPEPYFGPEPKTSLDRERALLGLLRQLQPSPPKPSRPQSAQSFPSAPKTGHKPNASLDRERALLGLPRKSQPSPPKATEPESASTTHEPAPNILPPLRINPSPDPHPTTRARSAPAPKKRAPPPSNHYPPPPPLPVTTPTAASFPIPPKSTNHPTTTTTLTPPSDTLTPPLHTPTSLSSFTLSPSASTSTSSLSCAPILLPHLDSPQPSQTPKPQPHPSPSSPTFLSSPSIPTLPFLPPAPLSPHPVLTLPRPPMIPHLRSAHQHPRPDSRASSPDDACPPPIGRVRIERAARVSTERSIRGRVSLDRRPVARTTTTPATAGLAGGGKGVEGRRGWLGWGFGKKVGNGKERERGREKERTREVEVLGLGYEGMRDGRRPVEVGEEGLQGLLPVSDWGIGREGRGDGGG